MEAKTPKEFFEKILPTKFKPDKAEGFDAVAQLTLSPTEVRRFFHQLIYRV